MFRSHAIQDDGAQEYGERASAGAGGPVGWAEIGATMPKLNACGSIADLHGWLTGFAHGLGFFGGRYVQLGRRSWGMEDREADSVLRHLSTARDVDREDEEWIASDPAIAGIRDSYTPFCWTTRGVAEWNARQRRWIEGERARGITAGMAIPVQDSAGCPAYLSLFGGDEESIGQLIERRAPELAFLAGKFHAIAKTVVPIAPWVGRGPRLSRREIECLKLAALGQTVDRSGHTLGISGRTVEFHLRNALEKLGAPTKLRAVVLAFGTGVAAET
jgi:DNA-binding CsgD family transcriptional regulator